MSIVDALIAKLDAAAKAKGCIINWWVLPTSSETMELIDLARQLEAHCEALADDAATGSAVREYEKWRERMK